MHRSGYYAALSSTEVLIPNQCASGDDNAVVIQQGNILQRPCCYCSLFPTCKTVLLSQLEYPLPGVNVRGYRRPAMSLAIG